MYLTVDIGGTKTLIALFDARRRLVKSAKFPTPSDQAEFLNTFFTHLQDYLFAQPVNIIVAVAGVVKNNRPTWFGNLPWHNPPLFETIKKLFNCPVFFLNDADAATLYEAHFYSGKSIYLTFSTGIGGGIAITSTQHPINNTNTTSQSTAVPTAHPLKNSGSSLSFPLLHHARVSTLTDNSATFEPGHEIYTWQGQPMEWEDIASANAIRLAYGDRPVTSIRGKSAYLDIANRVALGLAPIILKHQPNTIIFGGPLALTYKKWRLPLKKILKEALPANASLPKIRCAKKPNLCVSYGACYFGEQKAREVSRG